MYIHVYTMKYTSYLSKTVKAQGTPNVNNEGFALLMNIVHLEGAIKSLEKMKERETNPDLKYKYDIFIKGYQDDLDELTNGIEPSKLFSLID